jgi:hypothetical protein
MTTTRLHLAKLPESNFDAQAAALAARLEAELPRTAATTAEQVWALAQYVDLVDAGFGTRGSLYRKAVRDMNAYVLRSWQDPQTRPLLGRSAGLSRMVETLLDDKATGENVTTQACAA